LAVDEPQVDLWYASSDQIDEPELLDRYRLLLAPDEKVQWQRFRIERVRHQYLITRALIRSVLSCYSGDPPDAWVFQRNAYGKPSVAEPVLPGLEFNLSHTHGLVLCGVTREGDIGVDAERVDREVEHLTLAKRFFAPEEASMLETAPVDNLSAAFFRFWTLKESYIKARGMGLSIPLDDFAFSLDPGRPPLISFARPGLDDPDRWQFMEFRMDRDYQLAVALQTSRSEPVRVCVRQIVPLKWQSDGRVLQPSRNNRWFI
jgi:4'-phosphopantetheinyl transferase